MAEVQVGGAVQQISTCDILLKPSVFVSQGMNIDVLMYQWQDHINNSHGQHKADRHQFVLIGHMRLKYPNLIRPDD